MVQTEALDPPLTPNPQRHSSCYTGTVSTIYCGICDLEYMSVTNSSLTLHDHMIMYHNVIYILRNCYQRCLKLLPAC